MSGVVCLYFGPPGQCPECGGFNDTGHQYCSHDCAFDAAARAAALEEQVRARRAREDAFAKACDRLRLLGHTDEEIDVILAGMPT